MEILEALKTRRSIRRYKKDPIPQAMLKKILEAGRWAPSASNSQPWDFIVITESELKRRVARAHMYGLFLIEAPLGIAIIVDPSQSGSPVQDGTLAAYSIMLAAHGLELGSCWINPNGSDRLVGELLHIPPGKKLICTLAIGYPAEKGASQRRRLADMVHLEQYGNKSTTLEGE